LRTDDWNFKYTGNRFEFLGNGFIPTELDPSCDLGNYIRKTEDAVYSSRRKRHEILTNLGSKQSPGWNPVRWEPKKASHLPDGMRSRPRVCNL
jgi:hypothetical protein